MALATLSQLKLHLSITTSTDDTLLQQILDGACRSVLSYLDREIEQAEFTEYYSGNGLQDFLLRNTPVDTEEDIEVYLDSSGAFGQGSGFASDTLMTFGTDYVIVPDNATLSYSGIVRRLGLGLPFDIGSGRPYGSLATRYRQAVWPYGQGNIKVVYTGGYETVPADIVLAVCQLSAAIYRSRQYGGDFQATSEKLSEYSYTLSGAAIAATPADVPGSYANLLRPYKRWGV